ncbi:MAG: cell wall metabolism sensor histidine kinase WalK [Candidatus Glassbacteria bacterium]|nr:cell wall metabolism sensor histidine kinase WalK [Candidatus Glassbacteria bacterium]
MGPGRLEKMFSLRLGTKSIIAVIALLTTISAALTTFFVSRHSTELTEELRKRAFSLASNMAYNNQFSVVSGDLTNMLISISGVKQESDIQDAYIIDLKGVIIAHQDTSLIRKIVPFSSRLDSSQARQWLSTEMNDIHRTVALIDIERKLSESSEETIFGASDINPAGSATGASRHDKLGYVVLDVSLESMHQAVAAGTRRAVLITLVVIMLGAMATIAMVRRVALPIYRLADATRAVAMDDLDQEVPVTRSDEIGVLASSFNHMTRQLKVSRARIEAWNRELEAKVASRTRELQEKHEELEVAYEALKTLDKAKDDFLSLVSHELRTPLSSVLLYSEMLLDGMDDSKETRHDFLSIIVDNCRRLTRLINDVLDLSKIEAGRMPFKPIELDLTDIVAETVSGLKPTIDAKKLNYTSDGIEKGVKLWGDRDRVIQVLTNIISNAVKFTPEGGSISVALQQRGNQGLVSITDSGKGISREDIPKVFDRFSHLESIEHHSEGSGLGMTISKSIIERLGGEIWIESEIGTGATVFFTLPCAGRRIKKPTEEQDENGVRQQQNTDS